MSNPDNEFCVYDAFTDSFLVYSEQDNTHTIKSRRSVIDEMVKGLNTYEKVIGTRAELLELNPAYELLITPVLSV